MNKVPRLNRADLRPLIAVRECLPRELFDRDGNLTPNRNPVELVPWVAWLQLQPSRKDAERFAANNAAIVDGIIAGGRVVRPMNAARRVRR